VIGIVDYGMGNLGSVVNACRFLDLRAEVIADPSELAACRAVILPGVGAFGDCMEHLHQRGFSPRLIEWIAADRPFLGICVGLQALFESSEESPGVAGLGVLRGTVRRFDIDPALKVPQMGWNRVRQSKPGEPLFAGVPDGSFFYFVHSYYAAPADPTVVAGITEYGIDYCSAVRSGAVFAVQFHPEKSQAAGLQMLRNFGAAVQGGGGAA
jgi:glutamine amidotransferase